VTSPFYGITLIVPASFQSMPVVNPFVEAGSIILEIPVAIKLDSIRTLPFTWRRSEGVFVPIPTLPEFAIVIRETVPVPT